MDLLHTYLLGGLILHKAVWEILKRRRGTPAVSKQPVHPLRIRLVKAAKVLVLLGIVVQTCLPDVFPVLPDASALRVAGALIYTAGLFIALTGRFQLGNNWLDIEAANVTSSQQLVSYGVYRYIRHPIYAGDLILLIGLELALNSWFVIPALMLVPIVARQAANEETLLAGKLPGYEDYCRRTKRFVPFVI